MLASEKNGNTNHFFRAELIPDPNQMIPETVIFFSVSGSRWSTFDLKTETRPIQSSNLIQFHMLRHRKRRTLVGHKIFCLMGESGIDLTTIDSAQGVVKVLVSAEFR